MSADFRVLVTGSRTWTDATPVRDALIRAYHMRVKRPFVLVHGAAGRGADRIAASWAAEFKARGWAIHIDPHPADWKARGDGAGQIRNAEMVALGADLCLAFIRECESSKCQRPRPHGSHGATRCAELANAAGITTCHFRWEAPDGE